MAWCGYAAIMFASHYPIYSLCAGFSRCSGRLNRAFDAAGRWALIIAPSFSIAPPWLVVVVNLGIPEVHRIHMGDRRLSSVLQECAELFEVQAWRCSQNLRERLSVPWDPREVWRCGV